MGNERLCESLGEYLDGAVVARANLLLWNTGHNGLGRSGTWRNPRLKATVREVVQHATLFGIAPGIVHRQDTAQRGEPEPLGPRRDGDDEEVGRG